jgi:hypothetical protein
VTAVLMIRCDNPDCKAIGSPEYVPGQNGERKKRNAKVVAPYGWHQGEGWCVGTVPMFDYVACSTECVGPAITEQVRRFREADEQ